VEAQRQQLLDELDRQLRLRLVHVARFETGLRFEEAEKQREGGGVEHAVGSDRDHAVGQAVQIADVLAGGVVGGGAFLAVAWFARLVEAQDERGLAQRLAQQSEPLGADRLHRPLGLGQKVMERLRVGMDGRAQAGQGLAARLGQQPQVQGSELLAVAHVVEQGTILGAVLVDEGHRRGSRTHTGHGDTSCRRPHPAHRVPNMTDEQL